MNLPLKVKMKVILLTFLNAHLNNNIRSELIQIFKQYCLKKTVNQNTTKCALLADETATTSGEEQDASPPKVSKAKEIPQKGQKAASKPVVNQNATKHALLADETDTTSGEEHVASPPKVSKAKEITKKGQKAASDSDMDVEGYYIVEDDNKSDSSKYVPCINYPNDKVYPEDVKNSWVRLD